MLYLTISDSNRDVDVGEATTPTSVTDQHH